MTSNTILLGGSSLISNTKLVITWPDGTVNEVPLENDQIRVGRGEEQNDIAAPMHFGSISRKHFEISRKGPVFTIADLGSTNGVFVNGVKIEVPTVLQSGDVITIGSLNLDQQLTLNFVVEEESPVQMDSVEVGSDFAEHTGHFQTEAPSGIPYFELRLPGGAVKYFAITRDRTVLGRAPECDLKFPETLRYVSGKHLEITRTQSGYQAVDLDSTNGTRLNNQPLQSGLPVPLYDGGVIRIGDDRFGSSVGLIFRAGITVEPNLAGFSPVVQAPTALIDRKIVSIGRDPNSDIHLASADVSRQHAQVMQVGDAYMLEDLGSANGTYLNNQPIKQSYIKEGDIVQIGAHLLVFQNGVLTRYQSNGMRVDVTDLCKDVPKRQGNFRILHDINMTVLPREFIAVVGGSGAGKSTFMNALIGFKPGDGEVELNGHDFYEEFEHFRTQLGYVPQTDILHTSLTVEKALDYAARLRLPSDISKAERKKRIAEVLETVSMNTDTILQTRVSNLSGGQRKRVSIAAELLADPKLIYLDEATSGLDPGLEKKMMYTLRQMADEGRTVILITHATDNIKQTDHVAFLSQGRLVYFGPSQEALEFFDVDDFADIYERIERHGEKWEQVFKQEKPAQYQQYILGRKRSKPAGLKRDLPKIRFSVRDFIRQIVVLIQRTFSVLTSDWTTLALMLLLFPLTGILQVVISKSGILVGDLSIIADSAAAAKVIQETYAPFANLNTFIFVMGLEAVLVGMYVPSNELIKERSIYMRERMVNLGVLPYLLSKIAVFTIFGAIQTTLYLVVLAVGFDLPEQGVYMPVLPELFVTLFLTITASMGIGFVVSAISKSSDMAIYVLVLMLFFQFFFAGTVFDLQDHPAEPMSYLTATRWSLTALGITLGMEDQVAATVICTNPPDDPRTAQDESTLLICNPYPEAVDALMLDYSEENLVYSWLFLILMGAATLSLTAVLIKRLDA